MHRLKAPLRRGIFPLEVYDIAGNTLVGAAGLGAVDLDWQFGGFAADPPAGSMGSSDSTSQLVQAMGNRGAKFPCVGPGVDVRFFDDLGAQRTSSLHDRVKIVYLEPQQDTVSSGRRVCVDEVGVVFLVQAWS